MQEQIAFADVILLNKTDLVTPAELDELEARIRAINATAKIHRTTNCEIEARPRARTSAASTSTASSNTSPAIR